MANPKRGTDQLLIALGAVQVWPPQRLHKNHVRGDKPWEKGQKLLVGVVSTPYGHYLKELSSDYDLQAAKTGFFHVRYFEATEETVRNLQAHPRRGEIFA